MIKNTEKISEQKKVFFLLQFAVELIKNSKTDEIFQLERAIKEKEAKEKKEIIGKIKEREKTVETPETALAEIIRPFAQIASNQPVQRKSYQILKIPELKLPPRFQYLKPTPTEMQMDLGKLNPLIKDPAVKSIECNGPDEKISVITTTTKITSVVLSKEEINEIIQKFSGLSKIPVDEGVFRAAVGKLIISAIISDVIGSKFIIKKIPYQQMPGPGIFPGVRHRY